MDPQQIQAIHSLIDDLQQTVADATDAVIHAQNINYQVPDLEPDSQDYTTDSWDGSDAVASYPNPSSDETDLDAFRRNFLLAPAMESDQADVKSAYKLPFRDSHDGSVNVNALQAAQQAVNGARGGVDGVSEDQLRDAYDTATVMRVAAGDLEDADQAPEFSASVAASRSFHAHVEAADAGEASEDGLRGIVWASGQHDLWVNGDPTPVFVPEGTIPETYQRVQDRVQAGDAPTIGFDHPDDDSVAAQTALGEIGVAREFSQDTLDDGREAIVMRDSEFTNPKAVEAAEAGSFDGFGFSIVGNIALQEDGGEPVQREDGALVVEATEIQRIDLVPDQAVDGATNGNLPELAAAAEAAGRLAASSPNQAPDGLVRTLRAAAGSINDIADADTAHMTDDDIPTDPDDLDAAKAALTQASDTVEAKQEQIEELESQVASLDVEAEHFREIAASQGVDPDDEEFTPQDVVDAFSEDLRAEIADLEAALPKYDLDDQDDRVEALAGKPLSELEAMAGERWRAFGRSKAKRDELSAAVAADETVGSVESEATDPEETDQAARSVMTAREIHAANARGQAPTDFIESEHGVSPGEYSSEHELQAAISGGDP
jgi:predicted  nucleic acid-binding Zn-ribbon protein